VVWWSPGSGMTSPRPPAKYNSSQEILVNYALGILVNFDCSEEKPNVVLRSVRRDTAAGSMGL